MTTGRAGSDKLLQSLLEELKRLNDAQDKTMSNAVYVGLTIAEANELDMRRKRIGKVYEALIVLMTASKSGALLGTLLAELSWHGND